jgi:hypothetical protein
LYEDLKPENEISVTSILRRKRRDSNFDHKDLYELDLTVEYLDSKK